MDCSICSAMPFILRPPRNTICAACFEGAKGVMNLINKLEIDEASHDSLVSSPNSCKSLANLQNKVNNMKNKEVELIEKISFLSGFVYAFRDQILTDIELKPGDDGPSVPVHRALLASRSEILKNMLDSDKCKAPPNNTIIVPELNHEELQCLLEFLYSGSLHEKSLEKHVYSLALAADKYEIPYLQKICGRHMLRSLNSSNVLYVLEISESCSDQTLKESALNFVVKNLEEIVFSDRYDEFVFKNPHLSVQITRASLIEAKSRSGSGV